MVVLKIRRQNSPEMTFIEDNDVVQALSTNRADQPFNVRIGLRRRLHPMVPIRRDFFRSRIPSIHCTDASLRW